MKRTRSEYEDDYKKDTATSDADDETDQQAVKKTRTHYAQQSNQTLINRLMSYLGTETYEIDGIIINITNNEFNAQ
jgi:hypothetical protein